MNKKKKSKVQVEQVESKTPLSENIIISLFALILTIWFFFPAFCGKVESPIDIRNYYNYPWKYHSIDKKVIKRDLSLVNLDQNNFITESRIEKGKNVYKLTLEPDGRYEIRLKPDFTKLINVPIRNDFNYYLYFEFLPSLEKDRHIDFAIYTTDINKNITNLPFSAFPLDHKECYGDSQSKWLYGKVNLNFILDKLGSFEKLKDLDLIIVTVNKNKVASLLLLNNLKIIAEDFSNIYPRTLHNQFVEDLIVWFTPAREFFSESIKKGKIPFWNKYILSGTEFIAEPQVGYYNPIYFLSYFLFDHFTAHSIILIIFFFLCIFGSYKLSRSWGIDVYASLLVSLVYAFNPYMVVWFGYEHTIMSFAIIPFLFLAYDKYLKNANILNLNLTFAAFLFGILLLSGHLQVVYYSILFFLFYGIFKFLVDPKTLKEKILKHCLALCFILIFGFGVGAIVLFHFFPTLSDSHRLPASYDLLKANCVSLSALKGLIYPYYKGGITWQITDRYSLDPEYMKYKTMFFKNYLYFGFLPFLISLLSARELFKNKLVIFLYTVIIFSFLCAANADFYSVIQNIIPGFNLLQNSRFIEIYSYCIPFLVGIGFMNLVTLFPKATNKQKTIFTIIVILISSIDLIHFSSFYLTWSDRNDYKPIYKGGALEYLTNEKNNSKEPFRVLSVENPYNTGFALKPTSIKPNNLWTYKIEDVNGYASFLPKDLYWTFVYTKLKDSKQLYTNFQPSFYRNSNLLYPTTEYKDKVFDLLNVKYFITSPDFSLESDQAIKVFDGDSKVWVNKNYLPRAFLVSNYKTISNKSELISYIDSDNFNPRDEVVFNSIDKSIKNQLDSLNLEKINPGNKISFQKYEDENITLKVNTSRGGILVLGNNFNNNWKVKVNKKEHTLLKANFIQSGVLLPSAGEYIVEYYYYPKNFYTGALISCMSVVTLILLSIYLLMKSKAKKG
jgi:hypothetical protein